MKKINNNRKRLNNKGFTLVELLAVLVILIAIMSIAIPSISSSLERSKNKQDESKKKVLESAGELFVTDYKNRITYSTCLITMDDLKNNGYISDDALEKSDGDSNFSGCIIYTKSNNSYLYSDSCTITKCVS